MEEQTLQRTAVEKANALSHLFGALLAIPAGWYVISNGFDKGFNVGISMVIFTFGFFFLYFASFLYHWIVSPKAKLIFRHLSLLPTFIGFTDAKVRFLSHTYRFTMLHRLSNMFHARPFLCFLMHGSTLGTAVPILSSDLMQHRPSLFMMTINTILLPPKQRTL